jgi:hypothetical protein
MRGDLSDNFRRRKMTRVGRGRIATNAIVGPATFDRYLSVTPEA